MKRVEEILDFERRLHRQQCVPPHGQVCTFIYSVRMCERDVRCRAPYSGEDTGQAA